MSPAPTFAWVCEPCAKRDPAAEPWGYGVSCRASHLETGLCNVCRQPKRPRVEWRPLPPATLHPVDLEDLLA